jgi:uncharacterized protein
MTDTEATRLLKAYFASFRSQDWQKSIPLLFATDVDYTVFGPDALTVPTKHAIPWSGLWKGVDGVIAFQELLNQNFEVRGFQDHSYVAHGAETVALGRLLYTTKSTRQNVDSDFAAWVTVRDGKIRTYQFFENTFAIAHAFRTEGHWTVENGQGGHQRRQIPA